jgi:hypothetical protein
MGPLRIIFHLVALCASKNWITLTVSRKVAYNEKKVRFVLQNYV